MAVNPEHLDEIASTVGQLYREAETALAHTIARHLDGDLDRDIPEPVWAERKLAAVRELRRSASAILAGLQADTSRAIRQAAAEAFRAGWRSALDELPARWFPRSGLSESAWQRFVERGITAFYDRAGGRWKLGSYAEMATRTVTQRAAVAGQTDRLHAAGVSLVYVSNTVQECALCRPFEGRVLRLDAEPTGTVQVPHQFTNEPVEVDIVDTLAGAQLAGLFHPNCRHSVSAYLPGVTKPPQPTADPEGDKARQRQRQIERQIRKYKLRHVVSFDDDARKHANRKVREWQGVMRDHPRRTPELKRLRYREQPGAGNISASTSDRQMRERRTNQSRRWWISVYPP